MCSPCLGKKMALRCSVELCLRLHWGLVQTVGRSPRDVLLLVVFADSGKYNTTNLLLLLFYFIFYAQSYFRVQEIEMN